MPMEMDTTDLIARAQAGDHITAITSFSANVMTRFGLPRTLPEAD